MLKECAVKRGRTYNDDGCDELFQEVNLEKVGPVEMDKVYYEAFDMRSINILVSHNHDATIAKFRKRICSQVLLIVLQPNNLHDIV